MDPIGIGIASLLVLAWSWWGIAWRRAVRREKMDGDKLRAWIKQEYGE